MAAFDLAQFAHFCVVLCVRDLRGIEHMILIFVVAEFVAQLVDSLCGLLQRAGCTAGSGFGHSVHYRNSTCIDRMSNLWNPSRISLLAHASAAPASIAGRPTPRWP